MNRTKLEITLANLVLYVANKGAIPTLAPITNVSLDSAPLEKLERVTLMPLHSTSVYKNWLHNTANNNTDSADMFIVTELSQNMYIVKVNNAGQIMSLDMLNDTNERVTMYAFDAVADKDINEIVGKNLVESYARTQAHAQRVLNHQSRH